MTMTKRVENIRTDTVCFGVPSDGTVKCCFRTQTTDWNTSSFTLLTISTERVRERDLYIVNN